MAGPKNKTLGESMTDEEQMLNQDEQARIDHIKELRKERFRFRVYQFRKQWRIFYKSSYGKVGFYILVAFAVIALFAPVLEVHHDPLLYTAPPIDTLAPSLQAEANIVSPALFNGTPVAPSASALTALGANTVYSVTDSGKVIGVGLGSASKIAVSSKINLFNVTVPSGTSVLGVTVFPLEEGISISGTLKVNNFALVATSDGNLTLAKLAWTGGTIGSGDLVASGISNLNLHTTLAMMPISTSAPVSTSKLPNYVPLSSLSSGLGTGNSNYGKIVVLSKNSTGYYLSEVSDVPLHVEWTKKLPFNSAPTSVKFLGSYYPESTHQMIVVTGAHTIYSYFLKNGTEAWSTNSQYNFTGISYLPGAYDSSYSAPYNSIYEVMNGSGQNYIYGFYQQNGTPYQVFSSSSPITAISATDGTSGFPAVILAISDYKAYFISSPGKVSGTVDLISTYGQYVTNPLYVSSQGEFILSSEKGGLYALSSTLSSNPFNWGDVYSAGSAHQMSSLILMRNAESGKESIAFVSGNGNVVVYGAHGSSLNPLPPTLHTPSGTTLLLGTNINGNDVWSQFVASFTPDWLVGIAVGLIGVSIALVLGMIIGYYRGLISIALDTITLVIYLIPGLALLIALTSVLTPSFFNIIWILSFLSWPFTTFTILGIIRSLKQRSFVEAAKVSGAGSLQILRRHMLPNITPLMIYLTAINISGAVGGIATLQFLGLAPLNILTWGAMLAPLENDFFAAAAAPWWILPPTIALTLFVMAFIFISRGVDEVVNPRIRRR